MFNRILRYVILAAVLAYAVLRSIPHEEKLRLPNPPPEPVIGGD